MKHIYIITSLLLLSFITHADPGIGIVKDSKGFIYYTDLTQVWKIDPLTEKKEPVVRGVHTHELFMDTDDNLYGEHLWYNGGQLDTWGHYVWSLRSNGKLDTVIKSSTGFLENYSFVRDTAGNMYSVRRFKGVSSIQKISPSGDVTTLTEHNFRHIGWIHATAAGTVYLMDSANLYKIENGIQDIVTPKPQGEGPYSIWLDAQQNIYLAILGDQVVKKVARDGVITEVVHSPGDWLPASGLFDENGNLWLMETTTTNKVRVRKIGKEELTKQLGANEAKEKKGTPYFFIGLLSLLLIVAGWFIIRRRRSSVSLSKQ